MVATAGCTVETWRTADLQLDVDATLPANTEWIHICIDGVGEHLEGAANGRIAVPALPFADAHIITVEAWSDAEDPAVAWLGSTGPVTMTLDAAYTLAPFDGGSGAPCESTGSFAAKGDASWLLAVRFLGEEAAGSVRAP